jgi:hypothetical protein
VGACPPSSFLYAHGGVDNEGVPDDPEPPAFPGHTTAFAQVIASWGMQHAEAVNRVNNVEPSVEAVKLVRDDELVILSRMGVADLGIEAEVARRTVEALRLNREATDLSTAALVAFKEESATASGRLLTLTNWLVGFTVVLAFLSLVLLVVALKR